MTLNENGEQFTEVVKVDVASNIEEIKVPQHQDRAAIHILNDFNSGFSATKMLELKKCYISAIDPSEQKPAQMKASMIGLIKRLTNKADNNRIGCRKCGYSGHLSFECFNTLRSNPEQEVIVDVGSTSSETSDDELLADKPDRSRQDRKMETDKRKEHKKKKRSKSKRSRKRKYSDSSSTSSDDWSSPESDEKKRKMKKHKKKMKRRELLKGHKSDKRKKHKSKSKKSKSRRRSSSHSSSD